MRAVVQRVRKASVKVDEKIVGKIDTGYLVLLGIEHEDTMDDVDYLAEKIINLRIFEDDAGKMNKSLQDVNGQLLVVSQFTLHGDCRKGRRPSFSTAARPEEANNLYSEFVTFCKNKGIVTETGVFQAHMDVELCNNGPITLLIDSKKLF